MNFYAVYSYSFLFCVSNVDLIMLRILENLWNSAPYKPIILVLVVDSIEIDDYFLFQFILRHFISSKPPGSPK